MATANPFDLLGDSENDDPSLLIAAQQKKLAALSPAASTPTAAKLPSKPLPPAQAVRESRNNATPVREGTGRGGPGRGRGARGAGVGPIRDFENGNFTRYGGGGRGGFSPENGDAGNPSERGRGSTGQYRGSSRGGRRGGYVSGSGEGGFDQDRPQRRVYERRSGSGIGNEMKKEGAGRGNWGTVTDEVLAQETEESAIPDENEKQVEQDDGTVADSNKDSKKEEAAHETEKEPEDNEMTLEEYEKVREEKRKALLSMKIEERKVEIDKELQSMQQLTVKKGNDEVFIKLSSDKDSPKLRDSAEKEERTRKAMNINEFLKPAEKGRYYGPSGRGRGRGRGDRESSFRGGYTGSGASISPVIPSIEDQGQFPALGANS